MNIRARLRLVAAVILLLVFFASEQAATAQIIHTTTPFQSHSDSYFENFGINFGFSFPAAGGSGSRVVGLGPQGQLYPNVSFQQGGQAIPPFGGYNPGAGAQFGFRRVGAGGGGFGLGLQMAKGNVRTSGMSAPSITMMNGGQGYFFNGAYRPFVLGNIPVVGGFSGSPAPGIPLIDNGVTRAIQSGQLNLGQSSTSREPKQRAEIQPKANLNSTAQQGLASVKAIKVARQAKLAEERAAVEAVLAAGDKLAAEGERTKSRIKYRSALNLTQDEGLRQLIKNRLKPKGN